MPVKITCHWNGHAWKTAEHVRACNDTTCTGCKDCPEQHCEHGRRINADDTIHRPGCKSHNVDHNAGIWTCPTCIGKVKRTIRAIVDAYDHDLHEEAERLGVTSEAFMLIGPAVAPEIVHLAKLQDNPLELDPDHHPLRVLGDWDLGVRTAFQTPTAIRVTVNRSADYLTDMLAEKFPHMEMFQRFAADLTACLTHIEAVLHDSRQREVGARCPACTENAPKLQRRYAEDETDDLNDTWHCPADPAHWWTMTDYRLRVDANFVDTADWLPDSEASTRTDVPRATIRSWALRGHVTKRTVAGRIVYRITDILTRKEAS